MRLNVAQCGSMWLNMWLPMCAGQCVWVNVCVGVQRVWANAVWANAVWANLCGSMVCGSMCVGQCGSMVSARRTKRGIGLVRTRGLRPGMSYVTPLTPQVDGRGWIARPSRTSSAEPEAGRASHMGCLPQVVRKGHAKALSPREAPQRLPACVGRDTESA